MLHILNRLVMHDAVLSGRGDVLISGITADSRAVQPGFIFAALPGTKVDGNQFIAQAFAKGAVAAICQKGTYQGDGLLIESENPRRLLALMAARFFEDQPDTIVAVTGTNGKTSVTVFVRQIWEAMGFRAASLGTIGVVGPSGSEYLAHTTPDPVQLQKLAASLREDHVQHLAIEASSHGLSQYRLDGLRFTAGAFTNLTRDHLDYHASLEDYFAAKMRLFDELLPENSAAVINMDSQYGADVLAHARARKLRPYTVGAAGEDLKLLSATRSGMGQQLLLQTKTARYEVALPLVGEFQTSNALVAAGLVIASGGEESLALHALESLKGARGRLELVGATKDGANVFVDYAHTPDALENAIGALRPYVGGKLAVVFGCGGDRDKGKRPIMGEIANRLSDRVYVTDDNPRGENPATIRKEIMSAAVSAIEIGDRAQAIGQAARDLRAGDILLVAGKGHEEGQTVGSTTLKFSDHDAVLSALNGEDYHG
jgi:UDP-N-acetylmuramoyl-L-alanyl-D-glutamate--2,6-diaminopimelate ligase